METYDILPLTLDRTVTLCGTNVYPNPSIHDDRVMSEHNLLYIFDGEWEIGQDGIAYQLRSGDMMLMRAGSHHYGISPCSVNMRNMFFHFTHLNTDQYAVPLSSAEVQTYADGFNICLPTVIHCGSHNAISTIARNIINVYWSHRDDCERTLTFNLNCLLNELSFISRNSFSQPEEWITQLLREIRMTPSRYITPEKAARSANMSVRTMSSRFKKIMGKSLHEYQVSVKLEMSYNALCTGHYTVKEVARNFGFCDPYYFSRVFKKTYGMSPSEIKKGPPSANVLRRTGLF